MIRKTREKNIRIMITTLVLLVIIIFLIITLWGFYNKITSPPREPGGYVEKPISNENSPPSPSGDPAESPAPSASSVSKDIIILPTIDYEALKQDPGLNDMMVERKKKLGIESSLDLVVKSDETFSVGKNQVSMRDILEKTFLKKGEIFTEKIDESGFVDPEKIKEFGIYVVKPGDNIWNIHFNILKEYYEARGINVSSIADEPVPDGTSSGVGKLLKFSETMVIIYNLLENDVDTDINLLEPLSKIVVYNMDEVFSLLRRINYKNVNQIHFDGKTIWIPSNQI